MNPILLQVRLSQNHPRCITFSPPTSKDMKAVSADELKRYWRRWKRWGFFNGRLKYTDAHDCNIIVSKFYGDFVNEYTLDNDECPAIGIMYVNGFEHWAINGFESEDKMYVFEVQTGEVVDYEVNKQVAF